MLCAILEDLVFVLSVLVIVRLFEGIFMFPLIGFFFAERHLHTINIVLDQELNCVAPDVSFVCTEFVPSPWYVVRYLCAMVMILTNSFLYL